MVGGGCEADVRFPIRCFSLASPGTEARELTVQNVVKVRCGAVADRSPSNVEAVHVGL